ncbi:hypothetical protein [Dyadobacter fanqingshengii]|uniref:Uncharacterized protein n=1 Tax=Dyadobacter fanqingshengii TaxID=2906443 RepID=A0A9X1P9H0_9BACT|nr:hypothetical protein [Dyadobacter fanqingshengii]MCF0040811.1 hypothetical protein [Dyadobacter fanqingshengii]MCF2506079.1 hypothetical protein [Dyadobacter fanqingshengii]USJ37454.1 hypothetical protein NFI81_06660 [Dyadobacter fanqingshengii]
MKTAACIILLVLLLCNMLGLSLTVLCFDSGYKNASIHIQSTETQTIKIPLPSIPYAAPLELDDVENHLLRIADGFYNVTQYVHENDTLFVTLTPDASAHQRFAELSHMVQQVHEFPAGTSESPRSKTIKLLNDLIKIYLPAHADLVGANVHFTELSFENQYPTLSFKLLSSLLTPPYSPPEAA